MKNTINYFSKESSLRNLISVEKLFFLKEKSRQVLPKSRLSKQLSEKLIEDIKEYLTEDKYRELIKDSFGNKRKKEQLRTVIHSHISSKEFLDTYSIGDLTLDEATNILVEKIAGIDVLQKLSEIPTVTDIKVVAWDSIWVDDIYKGKYKTEVQFESEQDYLELCQRFSFASGKNFSNARPSINAVFPHMRVNIVGFDLSPKTSMSIRIVSKQLRVSEDSMKETGYATKKMIELLRRTFATHSHLISGATGTGKTELLRYLTAYIKPQSSLIMIEDTPETYLDELYPDKSIDMWKNRESADGNLEYGYRFHLRNAMRQNPDYITVQESRGGEARDIVKASTTGHIVSSTLHAETAQDAVHRMIDMCQEDQFHPAEYYGRMICRNFKIGVHIERFGKIRKINQIVEYVDYQDGEVMANVLFEYDPITDTHYQVDKMSSGLWNKLLAYHKDMPELEPLKPREVIRKGEKAYA